jgi:hypothetical protein
MDPSAKPQDFLTAAVHGVSMAVPYVLQRQSALTGQDPTQVESEVSKMRSLVLNPDALQKEADKFLSPIEKQELGNLKQRSMLAKDKDSMAKLEALKVDTAIKVLKASKKNNLLGNAESWQPVDGMRLVDLPEFDSFKAAKKPINLETIYREFVHNAPKEAKSSRAALVQQHLIPSTGCQLSAFPRRLFFLEAFSTLMAVSTLRASSFAIESLSFASIDLCLRFPSSCFSIGERNLSASF